MVNQYVVFFLLTRRVSGPPSRAGRDLLSPLARRPLQLALPGRSLQLAVPGCLPRLEARRDAGFRPGARCARSWPHPPHLRGCAGGRAFVLFRSRCRYSPAAALLLGGNLASAPNARTRDRRSLRQQRRPLELEGRRLCKQVVPIRRNQLAEPRLTIRATAFKLLEEIGPVEIFAEDVCPEIPSPRCRVVRVVPERTRFEIFDCEAMVLGEVGIGGP